MIDSVLRTGENYYPQELLEERKYVVEDEKICKYIIDHIEISSDSDRGNFDEKNSNEENSDEENLMKEI